MAEKKRNRKYLEGRKRVDCHVNEALFEQFNEQVKKDNITKNKVLEIAIYQYVNGILKIDKNSL